MHTRTVDRYIDTSRIKGFILHMAHPTTVHRVSKCYWKIRRIKAISASPDLFVRTKSDPDIATLMRIHRL